MARLPLKISDPQVPTKVQATLAALFNAGCTSATRHTFSPTDLSAKGLSSAQLRDLVTTGLCEVAGPTGNIVSHLTPIATEVEVFHSGDVAVTLAVDLVK